MKTVIISGVIKSMEPNDKGGLSIRVRSVHADGKGSNLEFIDVYGNYAKALKDKNIIAVGDAVQVTYEEKSVQIANPATGETDKWVTRKEGVSFTRTFRPTAQTGANANDNEAAEYDGLDPETF